MVGKQSLIVLIVLCFAQLCAMMWVQCKKPEVGAKTRAALFGDRDFAVMFKGTDEGRGRLAEVIARHRPEQVAERAAGK